MKILRIFTEKPRRTQILDRIGKNVRFHEEQNMNEKKRLKKRTKSKLAEFRMLVQAVGR